MSLPCKAYLGSTSQPHSGTYIFELYNSQLSLVLMTHNPCLEMITNDFLFLGLHDLQFIVLYNPQSFLGFIILKFFGLDDL